jgi:hypothetical protein
MYVSSGGSIAISSGISVIICGVIMVSIVLYTSYPAAWGDPFFGTVAAGDSSCNWAVVGGGGSKTLAGCGYCV